MKQKSNMEIWQYFSKWRNEWVNFVNQPPMDGEIMEMEKYGYEIRKIIK